MSALLMRECVFLHVPKCGGTWALSALRSQGIVLATIKDPDGADHPTLEVVRRATDLPAIAAVREPVAWLRSFWRFFRARDWRQSNQGAISTIEPLLAMATPSFAEFAQRYLSRRPGYVSELMRSYADGADWICRQESLREDLVAGLVKLGQPHVPDAFGRVDRANVSAPFAADLPDSVERKIREADSWIMDRWYADA